MCNFTKDELKRLFECLRLATEIDFENSEENEFCISKMYKIIPNEYHEVIND